MKNVQTRTGAGLLALAILMLGSVFLAAPASADDEPPMPVTVSASFNNNACVGADYTDPSMDAPDTPGTSQQITGSVAPGDTVTVVYTALEGFVIDGPNTFTHTFPAQPGSLQDCEAAEEPDPLVRDRSATRTDCDGIERREWQVVTASVWSGTDWVLGEPEVRNDTGWVFVRTLSREERVQLGCRQVAGDAGTHDSADNDVRAQGSEVPSASAAIAPTHAATPGAVPTSVDAGLTEAGVANAAPRGLAPLLGGLIVLAFAGFLRVKVLAEGLNAR